VTASDTVLINNVGAARLGDYILCPPPMPADPVNAVPIAFVHYIDDMIDEGNPDEPGVYREFLYGQFEPVDTDGDGVADGYRVTGALLKQGAQGSAFDGRLGIKYVESVGVVDAGYMHYGVSNSVDARISTGQASLYGYWGPPGDNGQNPYLAYEGVVEGPSANLSVDSLIGYDGNRIGYGQMFSIGAALLTGTFNERLGADIPFFPGTTLDISFGIGGTVEGVGAGAGAMGYYDTTEDRLHFKGLLDIAAVFGGALTLDISIGKKFSEPAAEPDKPGIDRIIAGSGTVFIGG
jgi:hypothetical protein